MATKLTKTQSAKVGKRIKENVGPVPDYNLYEKCEEKAVDHCMMNIKVLNGMDDLVLDFGRDYHKAIKTVDYHTPIFLMQTDKGEIRVEVERQAFQKKGFWQRYFCGSNNQDVSVALMLKGTKELDGAHIELYHWTAITNIRNVAEYVEMVAYQLRCHAETLYQYEGFKLEK